MSKWNAGRKLVFSGRDWLLASVMLPQSQAVENISSHMKRQKIIKQ